MPILNDRPTFRKTELWGVLERLCQWLELSEAQYQDAKEKYEGVGAWLADVGSSLLHDLLIYLQGSTALLTTVKPIARYEHDVDLVAHIAHLPPDVPPALVKQAIGTRLRANGHYAPLLEDMPRCWRLNYANKFHLDITPSIPNPACPNGGELVPDRAMRIWMATNPRGYRALFDRRAALTPRLRVMETATRGLRAELEPYPASTKFKGILRRIVQIAKRHRDQYFLGLDPCLAPISVILTTLSSRSYEYCVGSQAFDNEFDLLCEVIRQMPAFIEMRTGTRTTEWFIWNETTVGENFAEKWNRDPKRAEAFFAWHGRVLADLETLADVDGIDILTRRLQKSFGQGPTTYALSALTDGVSTARTSGRLSVAPAIGLTLGASSIATRVKPNTFFGAE